MKQSDKVYHLNLNAPFRPTPETVDHILAIQCIIVSIPCLLAIISHGSRTLLTIGICVATSLMWSWGCNRCKRPSLLQTGGHLYYILTGLLFASLIPATLPWYLIAGSMTAGHIINQLSRPLLRFSHINSALAAATIIQWAKADQFQELPSRLLTQLTDLTWNGNIPQLDIFIVRHLTDLNTLIFHNPNAALTLGCPAALILCGMYLIYRGYFSGRLPLSLAFFFLAGTALLPLHTASGSVISWPISTQGLDVGLVWCAQQFFSGPLIFLMFILPLDSLSRPVTHNGQTLYAVLTAVLILVLRQYTSIPAPDLTALIIAQCSTPLFDRITRPR